MQRKEGSSDAGAGAAQERHLAAVIRGSDFQHEAQQEAVRSRHGSSRSQAAHHEGRTICSAPRPKIESALRPALSNADGSLLCTRTL